MFDNSHQQFKFLYKSLEKCKDNLTTTDFQTLFQTKKKIPAQQHAINSTFFRQTNKKTIDFDIEDFMSWVMKYISLNNAIDQQKYINHNHKLFKQLKRIQEEIKSNVESYRRSKRKNSGMKTVRDKKAYKIKRQNIQISECHDFFDKINDLQNQNLQLNEKLKEHKEVNLKMFIKMNNCQSENMEGIKQWLQNYHNQYKLLQMKILRYQQYIQKLSQENNQQDITINKFYAEFAKLKDTKSKKQTGQYQKMKQIIDNQNEELQSLYNSMKTIIDKNEAKQLQYASKIEQLQQFRIKYEHLYEVMQSQQQAKSNSKNLNLDKQVFGFLFSQAKALEQILNF